MFQAGFADALSAADEVLLAPLYAPEKIAPEDRLDVDRVASDLRQEDIPARVFSSVDAMATHMAERAAPGDTIVIMSSGDFGGLHQRVLDALGDPVIPARADDKPRIAYLLDRLGMVHPVLDQFWSSYLVIPAPGKRAGRQSAHGTAGRGRQSLSGPGGGAAPHQCERLRADGHGPAGASGSVRRPRANHRADSR